MSAAGKLLFMYVLKSGSDEASWLYNTIAL